ncbi:MAG: glycoside hydrolase family 15 protein [Planctomycetota bacterium]
MVPHETTDAPAPAQPAAAPLEPVSRPEFMTLDHGVIGNGRLLGLVHPDSGFDWLCLPRFDSPSIFARILDYHRGGTWRFLVDGKQVRGKAEYVRNTNVLVTRFSSAAWEFELYDYMPRVQEGLRVRAPLRVMRVLKPVRGTPSITVQFDPRPDYGRANVKLLPTNDGLQVVGHEGPVCLFSNVPPSYILNGQPVALDRIRYFGLTYGPDNRRMHLDEVQHELDLTIAAWRKWTQSIALQGFAEEDVIRSALCLKLHGSEETGAFIAAATTSIPEAIGQPRTWDYRFCWLRDAAFTVEALRRVGHFEEGLRFIHFVRDVVSGGPLQPLYAIGGERELPEEELYHLAGFRGTQPVRIGNAASQQVQNDLMGEVMLCLSSLLTDPRVTLDNPRAWFPMVERMVLEARIAEDNPDLGIWEYRDGARIHTFSQAMCWAAIHNGARVAAKLGFKEQAAQWRQEADRLRGKVLDGSFNKSVGMFTETYGGEGADASILLLPQLGLLQATDPRFLSTIERYREILVHDAGVMRYVHQDDFGEPESGFQICSFWWVDALAQAGHLDEAIERFEQFSGNANPLGLMSEDIDLTTKELLGNFPQAYTHVGLINSATTIGHLARIRDNRFTAWS